MNMNMCKFMLIILFLHLHLIQAPVSNYGGIPLLEDVDCEINVKGGKKPQKYINIRINSEFWWHPSIGTKVDIKKGTINGKKIHI